MIAKRIHIVAQSNNDSKDAALQRECSKRMLATLGSYLRTHVNQRTEVIHHWCGCIPFSAWFVPDSGTSGLMSFTSLYRVQLNRIRLTNFISWNLMWIRSWIISCSHRTCFELVRRNCRICAWITHACGLISRLQPSLLHWTSPTSGKALKNQDSTIK